jgi:hypothetical protein
MQNIRPAKRSKANLNKEVTVVSTGSVMAEPRGLNRQKHARIFLLIPEDFKTAIWPVP